VLVVLVVFDRRSFRFLRALRFKTKFVVTLLGVSKERASEQGVRGIKSVFD